MAAAHLILPEILDNIFEELGLQLDSQSSHLQHSAGLGTQLQLSSPDSEDTDEARTYCPNYVLYPLLFVCKWWHDIAKRRLYNTISLGLTANSIAAAASLAATLHSNPQLASLVRKLLLHRRTNHLVAVDTCDFYTRILTQCTQLTSVTITDWDCDGIALQRLKSSLQGLTDLQRLTIDLDECPSEAANLFASFDEILRAMMQWPNLTYLDIIVPFGHSLWDSDEEDEGTMPERTMAEVPSGHTALATRYADYRSRLKQLNLGISLALHEGHIRALEAMAPKLTSLILVSTDEILYSSRAALRRAIRTWAPHLKTLVILSRTTKRPMVQAWPDWPLINDELCRELGQLRALICMIPLTISVSSLSHLRSLAQLWFAPTQTEHVDELANIVPQLAALKTLQIMSDMLKDDRSDVAENLEAACAAKEIELEFY